MNQRDHLAFLDRVTRYVRDRAPTWDEKPRHENVIPLVHRGRGGVILLLNLHGILLHSNTTGNANTLDRFPIDFHEYSDPIWRVVWRNEPRYATAYAFSGDSEEYDRDLTKLKLFIP
jgi:hypothetical protein